MLATKSQVVLPQTLPQSEVCKIGHMITLDNLFLQRGHLPDSANVSLRGDVGGGGRRRFNNSVA